MMLSNAIENVTSLPEEPSNKRFKSNETNTTDKVINDICDCWSLQSKKIEIRVKFKGLLNEGKMIIISPDEFHIDIKSLNANDTYIRHLKKKWEVSRSDDGDYWVIKRQESNNHWFMSYSEMLFKVDKEEGKVITPEEKAYSFGFARLNPKTGGVFLRADKDRMLVLNVGKVILVGLPCVLDIKSHIVRITNISSSSLDIKIDIEEKYSQVISINQSFLVSREKFDGRPSYISSLHANITSLEGGIIKIEACHLACVISKECDLHILPDYTYNIISVSSDCSLRAGPPKEARIFQVSVGRVPTTD
jgi:hypothetical protein